MSSMPPDEPVRTLRRADDAGMGSITMLLFMTVGLFAFALVALDLRAWFSARQQAQDVADAAAAAAAGETREALDATTGTVVARINRDRAPAAAQRAFAASGGASRRLQLIEQECLSSPGRLIDDCNLGWHVEVSQAFESLTLRLFGGGSFDASASATAVPEPVTDD